MVPTSIFLLQLIVVLAAARLCGWVLQRLGQPAVVGEMTAGFLVGPVVMGEAFPELQAKIFGPASLGGLSCLSTLGLVLFMFIVGLEMRAPRGLKAQLRSAGYVGLCSVVVPMALGLAISPALYPSLAPAGIGFWTFAFFISAASSITAFPVLARILKDRGATATSFGQLALGSAAVVDVVAWLVLALVLASGGAGDGYASVARTSLGLVVLLLSGFLVFRPMFATLLRTQASDGTPSVGVLAALIVGLLVCSALTEWLHLHAVIGAFLFGLAMPRDDRLLRSLAQMLEPVSVVVLMPLFFALAGLSTTRDAFHGTGLAAIALIVVTAAIGKIGGGALGSRLSGYRWNDSMATGVLMNARGLMELIVMKIGLDAGIIGPALFTMLLVMAIVTTAMTGPLLSLLVRHRRGAIRPGTESGESLAPN